MLGTYLTKFLYCHRASVRMLSRTMSKFYVKVTDSDDRIFISFNYSHQNGAPQEFNANRPKDENIGMAFVRIAQNIDKRVNKKKKKTKDPQENVCNIKLEAFLADGKTKIDDGDTLSKALTHGNVIRIQNEDFIVDLNPPNCLGIVLPETMMVGFPIFPRLDLEYASLDDCEFEWMKVKYVTEAAESKKPKQKAANDEGTVLEQRELCKTMTYTPVNDDIGFHLQFSCAPKLGDRIGRQMTVVSKNEVTAGPGLCPFEQRQVYTQATTGDNEFRVVSYNILADLYADQDYSRDVLFNYCPPYALAIEYRKHLLIRELQGYNSDIMCLQEVDRKVYMRDLSPIFDLLGYGGAFAEKDGEVSEGSAIFYRKSKFKLIEEYVKPIKELLETTSMCQDIVKKVYAIPAAKELTETRSTIIHVLAMEELAEPGRTLVVANTHLFFHPDAGHIRVIQTVVAMRYIESLLKVYKHKNPSMIFCGDFNSSPDHGVYEFMTSRSIKEDNKDWKDATHEQHVPGMNFSHSQNLASGCGIVPFTNYTPAFHAQLDYIYFDTDRLEVTQVVPPPDLKDVELNSGLPSIVFPSDHIAQICDLKWKK